METSNWVEGEWTRDMATLLYSSTFFRYFKNRWSERNDDCEFKMADILNLKKKAVASKFIHTIIIGIWRQNKKHNKKKFVFYPNLYEAISRKPCVRN